jgi:hypothetical protein
VIADQQHRPLGGNAVQATHVGPEIQRRQQPGSGQLLADIVRVALIEVGLRDARRDLMPSPFDNVA